VVKIMRKLEISIYIVLLIALVSLLGTVGARCQNKSPFRAQSVVAGKPSTGGLVVGGGGGGDAPPLYGGVGVFGGGGGIGPWINIFTGGLSSPCDPSTKATGVGDYMGTTSCKVIWQSSLADSGSIKWDEWGATDWNYQAEAGPDSTVHYLEVTGRTGDYTRYVYYVRTGSDGCYSVWSDIGAMYTLCGNDDVSSTTAEYAPGNYLRVDPVYKNKAQMRWQKQPSGDYESDYAWKGGYDTSEKSYGIGSQDASSTYKWWYRLLDPCGNGPSWTYVGTFTTDFMGGIE